MNEIRGENIKPLHFNWVVENHIGTITLNRPDRKNPLTFESYAELRDLFHQLQWVKNVNVLIITGEGGNFCSGGDVHDIIGPLTKMDMASLLDFTRMTGDLVKQEGEYIKIISLKKNEALELINKNNTQNLVTKYALLKIKEIKI